MLYFDATVVREISFQDAHTLDFGEFKYGKTNITALRLIDPQRHMVQAAVHDLTFAEEKRKRPLLLTPDTVKVFLFLFFNKQVTSISSRKWKYHLVKIFKNLEISKITNLKKITHSVLPLH